MNLRPFYKNHLPIQVGVVMPLPHVERIGQHIHAQHEKRQRFPPDIEPFPLPHGVEVRSLMPTDFHAQGWG